MKEHVPTSFESNHYPPKQLFALKQMSISLPTKMARRAPWQSSSSSWSRRSLQMFLVVIIGSACFILTVKPESGHVLRNFSTNVLTKQATLVVKSPRICKTEEIVNGRWVNDRPLKSLDEMRSRYGLAPNSQYSCSPTRAPTLNPDGNPQAWPEEEIIDRVLKVASPRFVPVVPSNRSMGYEDGEEEGCEVRRMDREDIITRLLRSRRGLVMLGDSIMSSHMQIFENYLNTGDGSVQTTWQDMWSARITLDPNHSLTTERLLRAGVTRKRLETPLIEFYRHHHLVDAAGRAEAFSFAGAFYQPNSEQFPSGPEDWYQLMIDGAVQGDFIDGRGVREEPTPMLINVGAHMVNFELGDYLTPMHHLEAIETIIRMTEDKIQKAPILISPFLRTVAPGHGLCERDTEPSNTRTSWRSPTDPTAEYAHVNTFPIMNGIMWKGRSSEREPGSFDFAEGQTRSSPAMRVMDIYPMSVKRGDAHLTPPSDCLHWCTTGPQDPWNDLFFHMLLDESLNQDYEG